MPIKVRKSKKDDKSKLIINYSSKAAKRDYHNREKDITILKRKLRSNKNAKKQINNRGYNKQLKLSGYLQTALSTLSVYLNKISVY